MERHNQKRFDRVKPFIGVIFIQFGYAGMDILSKAALNKGMSNYVFVVYRHAVAFIIMAPFAIIFEKKLRPTMKISIFRKIVMLSLLEPVIDQNLYFLGMKYTTATFVVAMTNILPAITFLLACILKRERIKIKSIHSQAKVVGTLATVAGAMVMTLIKGPIFELFGTHGSKNNNQLSGGVDLQHAIKGSVMITIGCISWACFIILQAITLEAYPAELSLTTWICLLGTIEGSIVALVMERGNPSVWSLNWDAKLLAIVYSLLIPCAWSLWQSWAPSFWMNKCTLEGLYLVVWGKSKDYNSPSPTMKEHILPAKQTPDESNTQEHYNPDQVITISNFGVGEM
ncbi:EamA domain [Sesbania bispinosa]|nr:EamA domain [Sesbania bispinosa]